MRVFDLSKQFPPEERYSLTDQVRRSSRSVCANLAEAWRKRRYESAFVSKLSDVEAEAAETQVWIEFAVKCSYLDQQTATDIHSCYDRILKTVVGMIAHANTWTIPRPWSTCSTPTHPLTHSPTHPFTHSLSQQILPRAKSFMIRQIEMKRGDGDVAGEHGFDVAARRGFVEGHAVADAPVIDLSVGADAAVVAVVHAGEVHGHDFDRRGRAVGGG